jgi:hypothetical protein
MDAGRNGQTILIFWNAKHSYHFASWPGAGRQGQIGLSQGGFGSPRIGRKCRINDVDQADRASPSCFGTSRLSHL